MNKDSQVKLGLTLCDCCNRPATKVRGQLILCDQHADEYDYAKAASITTAPLKAAPIMLSSKHE